MGSAVLGEGILAIDYDDKGRRVMEGYIWWAVQPRASPKLIPNDKVMGGFGALFHSVLIICQAQCIPLRCDSKAFIVLQLCLPIHAT